jgi:hypothetical protein
MPPGHHARHGGDGLQQQRVARVPPLEQELLRHHQRLDQPVRQLVRQGPGLVVLLRVDRRVPRLHIT